MRIGRACREAVQCHTVHTMVHKGMAHGRDGGGTRLADVWCIMVYINHCHRFACSVMLELGSRAPIVIKWPAVVLVIWPHFNGNAQRRPHGASLGLALFSMRICCFLCTSHGCPRGKSNRLGGCRKILGRIPCFLVGSHGRFYGLLACLVLEEVEKEKKERKKVPKGGESSKQACCLKCAGVVCPTGTLWLINLFPGSSA